MTREAYETWIRTVDYPAMRGLKRVKSFVTRQILRNLFDGAKPGLDYVEVFEIDDLDGFMREDLPGPVVQGVMGQFMQYAENPQFMVAEAVA